MAVYMNWIASRLFVAHLIRLMAWAVAGCALCQCLTGTASAQVVWPSGLERAVAQVAAERAAIAPPPREGGILNLNIARAAEWRADFLSLTPSGAAGATPESGPVHQPRALEQPLPDDAPANNQKPEQRVKQLGFNWQSAFRQSMIFLGIQHAFRLATEEGTRRELRGPFFKDYFRTLRSLRGWDDGDPFIVNYIGHPMMGAATGFIQIQNDPHGINEEVSLKKSYWKSRLKAFGWSFAYSTQFELGLFSEASLGNIGLYPYEGHKHPMAYVDIVVTPVVGTGWLVGEDLLDKYLINRLEDRLPNRTTILLVRSFLNPTRSFANAMRGKWPWHRDNRK